MTITNPTDIAGLELWLDYGDETKLFVDAGITPVSADGQAIYQANDKSGNANHATQTVEASRPLYKAGIQNGKSVARLDGIDDWMDLVGTSVQPTTIFMVAKHTSNYGMFVQGGADVDRDNLRNYGAGAVAAYAQGGIQLTVPLGWYIWHASMDNVEKTLFFRLNGGEYQSTVFGGGTFGAFTHMGVCIDETSVFNASDIAEIIVYNSVLSLADYMDVEQYLSSKWGIALPNSISITSPLTQYKMYQRNALNVATVTVTGTYTGTPTNIEYQINSDAWATLEVSPTGNSFSGNIDLPAGNNTIGVRFSNDTGVTDTTSDIRVGDIFGWIGQSNQDGRLTNGQAYTGTETASVFDEVGLWKNLLSNYKSPNNNYYSVLPLLASLIEAEQGVPIAFVCETEGGTTLCPPTANWSKGGTNYEAFIATVKAAGINDIKAFLWYQGEQDVANSVARATYSATESLMLDNLQTDTGFNKPLVSANIATLSQFGRDSLDAIRLAKIDNWENDADIYAGPTGHDQDFADNTHWSTDAQATTLSQRWWRCIEAAIYSGAESGRGPQFSSATRSGTTVRVTFTNGEGVLQNQTDETGFRFTDDGVEIAILSAVANDTDAVDLTLAGAPSGTELVSFASGSDSVGATLKDNGTYTLPPEPFVDKSVNLSSGGTSRSRIFGGM